MAEKLRPVVRTRDTTLPRGSGASISDIAIPRIGRRCANSRHPTSSHPKTLYRQGPSEFVACVLLVHQQHAKQIVYKKLGCSSALARLQGKIHNTAVVEAQRTPAVNGRVSLRRKTWKTLPLWEHQQRAVQTISDYIEAESDGSALIMPTGTGKTGVIATVARCLPNIQNVLILTPWAALRKQLERDLNNRFWSRIGVDIFSICLAPCDPVQAT